MNELFIVGLEDGILPLHGGKNSAVNMEEERRLFYVGITRAKHKLYLSHNKQRNKKELQPSPFIKEIQDLLLQKNIAAARTTKPNKQLSIF